MNLFLITRNIAVLLSIFGSFEFDCAAKEGACVQLDRMGIIGKSIWAHTNRMRGYHGCNSRIYIEHDINSDGEKDMLVVYAIAGGCFYGKKFPPGSFGNHHEEFISVFLKKKREI